MRTLLLSLALVSAVWTPPLAGQTPWSGSPGYGWNDYRDARYPLARLWIEDERDYFRRGQRLDVRFSVSEDAYVALIHIDTDGNLDFLYPLSPWDEGYVRGGRVHTLPRGYASGWTVRGSAGIGYLYLIASPYPLDYRNFAGRRGGAWDWSYAGRSVRGDPFWAMEQISRLLVPDPYTPFVADYYSYHVGGRHRYPAYACADRFGYDRGWGWSSSYGACDRLDYFLREHPYYYDARLYRGDRRAYFRDRYGDRDPRHEYKEPLDRRPSSGWDRSSQPAPAPRGVTPQRREPLPREAAPERRPSLERRGTERRGASPAPASPAPRPTPRASGAGARGRPAPAGRVAPRPRPVPRDTLQLPR